MAILLVEDDWPTLFKTALEVANLGHEIVTAYDAETAITIAKHTSLSLLICDIRLPGQNNGIDIIKQIKRLKPGLPILVLSNYPDKYRQESLDAGANKFIAKVEGIKVVIETVRGMLNADNE